MNVAAITGRLVQDPELRATSSGKSVVSFTLAVVDPDNKESTDFIDCVAWEGRAEFLSKYFTKGQKVEVTGKIKTRTFEKKDGQKGKATELVARNIGFAESKKDSQTANETSNSMPDGGFDDFQMVDNDDDLPF